MALSIITNNDVLSESHIPENISHREKELTQLSNAINVVNTFVHGPNGSGKTLLVKKAIATKFLLIICELVFRYFSEVE